MLVCLSHYGYVVCVYATYMEMLLPQNAGDDVYFGEWQKPLWSRENEALLKSCGLHSNTNPLPQCM